MCSFIKRVLLRKTPVLESLFNKVAGLRPQACNVVTAAQNKQKRLIFYVVIQIERKFAFYDT